MSIRIPARGWRVSFFAVRRKWAVAVGAEKGWPFSDLAGALDPDAAVEPALLATLDALDRARS